MQAGTAPRGTVRDVGGITTRRKNSKRPEQNICGALKLACTTACCSFVCPLYISLPEAMDVQNISAFSITMEESSLNGISRCIHISAVAGSSTPTPSNGRTALDGTGKRSKLPAAFARTVPLIPQRIAQAVATRTYGTRSKCTAPAVRPHIRPWHCLGRGLHRQPTVSQAPLYIPYGLYARHLACALHATSRYRT